MTSNLYSWFYIYIYLKIIDDFFFTDDNIIRILNRFYLFLSAAFQRLATVWQLHLDRNQLAGRDEPRCQQSANNNIA